MSLDRPSRSSGALSEKRESLEKGKDVEVLIEFIRHGERALDGTLTDLGRRITKEKGRAVKFPSGTPHAVKAIGSSAGPKQQVRRQDLWKSDRNRSYLWA
jgi:hypothetical protein